MEGEDRPSSWSNARDALLDTTVTRLAWLTDIHLNFVGPGNVDALCRSVLDAGAGAVLLTGDVAEAPDLVEQLEGLDDRLGLPVYFVLGNHDFYRGSIARVRAAVEQL